MRSRQMRLLAALWALRSSATGAPTNGTQPAAPTNGTRVAVLLPGEMRFPDFDNLAASLAAFDVFVSTYAEDEGRARRLRPTGLVLTPRAEVSLASGRMYQWYHLDRLLREFKDALLAYDVLFRTRTDAHFFETMTPAHLRVGDDALDVASLAQHIEDVGVHAHVGSDVIHHGAKVSRFVLDWCHRPSATCPCR